MAITLPYVLFSLYNINRLDFTNEVQSVYWEVRTETLYNTDTIRLKKDKSQPFIHISATHFNIKKTLYKVFKKKDWNLL